MAVGQADKHGRARRRGLIIALKRLTSLNHRQGFGGIDTKCIEHFGCQNFPHCTFQCQPAIRRSRKGCLARTLSPQIEDTAIAAPHLGKEKTTTISKLRIVMAELVAMITESQRGIDIVRQRGEFAEMFNPGLIIKPIKTDTRCSTVIAKAQ